MKLSQRVYNYFSKKKPTSLQRSYKAARVDRHNADWVTMPTGANWTLRQDLQSLRARARWMCKNLPQFKKYLSMCRNNIIGEKGIQLQVRARLGDTRTLDAKLNKKVEEAFWAWSFAENCNVTGKMDWIACQRLFVTHLARDGEVLVRMYTDADNPFGFSLKFINVDWLDETFNESKPGANRIIMSVEVDANDKPVAYWLTTPPSEITFDNRRTQVRVRVPAEEMIHAYIVGDDESQTRGVSWLHASLLTGRNMLGYDEGVIQSARYAANSFGFLTQPVTDDGEYTGATDEEGNPIVGEIRSSPMQFTQLPPGYQMQQFDPKQPTQQHAEFKKTIHGDLATGLEVNYFELSGDMASVNYSSARVGLGETRDTWRTLQDFVAAVFCRPVYHKWLYSATFTGAVKLTGREYREVQNPMWRPRGWRYVDPHKEIAANVVALENKLTTWTDVLAEQGIDIYDHFETLAQEQELAAKYGIELVTATAVETANQQPDAEEEATPKQIEGRTNGHSFEHYEN